MDVKYLSICPRENDTTSKIVSDEQIIERASWEMVEKRKLKVIVLLWIQSHAKKYLKR